MTLRARIIIASVISIIMIITLPLSAEEDEHRDFFSLLLGAKGGYSGGLTEDYHRVTLYMTADIYASILKFTPGYFWYQHYQVTDGNGNYSYTNIHRFQTEAAITPHDMVELTAGYRFSVGAMSFVDHGWYGSTMLFIDAVTIRLECNGRIEEYLFDSIKCNNWYLTGIAALAYDFSDTIGIEAEYMHDRIDINGAEYFMNQGSLGIYGIILNTVFLSGRILTGSDSADYRIIGANFGINWEALENFNIVLTGSYAYYLIGEKESSSGSGKSNNSKYNPQINPSIAGSSFSTWGVILGISYRI